MVSEPTTATLGEISEDVAYGYTESASEKEVGPRFLRITDIQNGVVNWSTVPFCPISESDHEKYRLHAGDIVVARTGNSTGENFLFRGGADSVFASYLIRFRVDQRRADPAYVWYNLRTKRWWNYVHGSKTGSAQAGANAKVLGKFEIQLPPLPEQKAIARILGALDDKIELNRRMNATLEAMARALFQSWFVDFDPVHAKAAGRAPAGMDQKTAALFPSSFQSSELGEIPTGWAVGSILKQARLLSGGTPKTNVSEYWDGDIPWASAKDVSQCGESFLICTERQITKRGLEESTTKMIPAFATVVVARGATTGRLTMLGESMAMNQTCYGLQSTVEAPLALYCQARTFIEQMVHAAHGSVFDTITTKTFETTEVLLPPPELLRAFHETVNPVFAQIRSNLQQSRTLATLRDTLLPKLLSGELSPARASSAA